MRNPPFVDILAARIKRRDFLSLLGKTALAGAALQMMPAMARAQGASFKEVPHALLPTHQLAEGYRLQTLLRWGDPLFPDTPEFDVNAQSEALQARQFGTSCDFVAYLPLPKGTKEAASSWGLLWVNHEYPEPGLMFPGFTPENWREKSDAKSVAVEMMSVGGSIVEVGRDKKSAWSVKDASHYARRITAMSDIRIGGPAAGHAKMKTKADPSGRKVKGTFANCAGGVTPWGTVLTCEENFNDYFFSAKEAHPRYGVGKSRYQRQWHRFHERFDADKEPNEPNRFGWVVEINPYDPAAMPVKRTALGRFKHETATVAMARDGRVVIYSGDDEAMEYLYKFVSARPHDPKKPDRRLLDDGVLHAAKFEEDGALIWLPLVYGQGPLIEKNGFSSQAEVLIETRRAADLMGATPMDRPEGIAVDTVSGHVFCSLSKNAAREKIDAANPRAHNIHGHIVTLMQGDHADRSGRWEVFLLGGDPKKEDGAFYPGPVSENGWLSCPDNLAISGQRLWIGTDGQPESVGVCDGLYAVDLTRKEGPRQFFTGPVGAEITGPCLTPDGKTMFLSVQHPGEGASLDKPPTRWPDFDPKQPPRSSVVVIVKDDGGVIGS